MSSSPSLPREILNLGCGDHHVAGAVGCDLSSDASAADVRCDLNRFPYPFRDGQFSRILCRDVLEHLDDIPRVMEELHRLLRPGGVVEIRVPHYTSMDAYGDPTHRRFLSVRSFNFCLEGETHPGLRTQARFRLRRREIVFFRPYRLLGIAWLANRFPQRWEGHFAFWFPAHYMLFELEALSAD
jgi:SAM-dependent methyltransferase